VLGEDTSMVAVLILAELLGDDKSAVFAVLLLAKLLGDDKSAVLTFA
jgi:hypothetical protein